ncbi:hypothetical protein ACFXAF_12350 [Kitasatospora sp. NPDC059463]|uniref:hypothetical protein n=1 Tax=unclassified Kitasatospora TaxID=2633591 RepID=UPI0036C8B4EA
MPYAIADELRLLVRPDGAFTADEAALADLLLDLAAGAVEEETGQSLEHSTDAVLLDSTGGVRLVLPRWPVTAVSAVTLTNSGTTLVAGTDYTWSAAGILYRRGACWPHGPRAVDALVSAGHAPVPRGVRAIVLRLAKAAMLTPGVLSQETLGDHSVTYASPEEAGMVLTEADRRTLSAYRART